MDIGLLNYADVRNFGDVLFPLVVSNELQRRIPTARCHFITSTGSSWAGMNSTRLDEINIESFDALILGGGEVIHRYDEMLNGIYKVFNLDGIARPTDIVFGWATAKRPFKAWLALGVPEIVDGVQADIRHATSTLDFVSARGSRSFERLRSCGAANVSEVPDLGWLFPRLLEGFNYPSHIAGGRPYIVVQALQFKDLRETAYALANVSDEMGLEIVLLPLTRCWQDEFALQALAKVSRKNVILVDDRVSDLEKLTILGGATAYVGQSMHGLIGSLGQGRMGGVCMLDTDDKFRELLLDTKLSQFRCEDWSGTEMLIRSLLWAPVAPILNVRQAAVSKLDKLFDEIVSGILGKAATQH